MPAIQSTEPAEKPFQFTLRHLVLAMLGLSFLFALLFQWGWLGFAICWVVGCVAAMCYGAYWARWDYLLIGFLVLVAGFSLHVYEDTRTPGRWSQCKNNLRHLGIALQNYHDTHGTFPPAYIADKNGRPMHSWRVLILPFIEQQALYSRYRFDEPWDGPNNRLLAAEVPDLFRCPSEDPESCDTSYVAVVGLETCWPEDKAVAFSQIRDGTSNTILVVESHRSGIHWMEPRDLHMGQMTLAVNPVHGQGICSCHGAKNDNGRGTTAQFVRADGSMGRLDNNTPAATVRGMLTIDGGEKIELP
jgi:hypothetical protein